jgi:hypothetical protein
MVHVLDRGRLLQRRKYEVNTRRHLLWKPPAIILFVETPEALVPKAFDHEAPAHVNCQFTFVNFLFQTTR